MQTIEVEIHIRAPIEKVWALFTEHEGYTFISRVSEARLLELGRPEKNGLVAAKIIVLFFSYEVLAGELRGEIRKLALATLAVLTVIGVRGFLG